MRLLTLLLMVGASLAGCADEGGPVEEDDGFGLGLQATEDTGIIRGVVVDAAIVPVPNATVVLQGIPDAQTATNAEGVFGFDGIDPGSYFLDVSKRGYKPAQAQAQVVAGDPKPPVVKVQLTPIPGFEPFRNAFQWTGFIQCNSTYANICFIVNFYPNFVLGTGNITNDDSLHSWYDAFVDEGEHPNHTQVETVWDSTQPLGSNLRIRYETANFEESFFIACILGSVDSESPQVFRINVSMAQDAGLGAPDDGDTDAEGECNVEEPMGLVMEFFSGDALGVCQPLPVVGCHPQVGATIEQKTTTFAFAFYDYEPPEDWTFVEDASVPPPPG